MGVATREAKVEPDGLLLYVKQASYEPGTSPLSGWVPVGGDGLDVLERLARGRLASAGGDGARGEEVDMEEAQVW